MNEKQRADFARKRECNFAIALDGVGRFRVNAFQQQMKSGMVLRVINTKIPDIETLDVPPV